MQGACMEPILSACWSLRKECSLNTRILKKYIRMFVNMETFYRYGQMNNAANQLGVAQWYMLGKPWNGIETHPGGLHGICYESICQTSCPFYPFISPHLWQHSFQHFVPPDSPSPPFILLCYLLLFCQTSACWNVSGLSLEVSSFLILYSFPMRRHHSHGHNLICWSG